MQEVTFPWKSHFPESHVTFSVKLHFPGNHTFPRFSGKQLISQKVSFPRKSYFQGRQISREDKFPGNFPGSHFSGKSDFSGKSHFPGSHKVPLVQPKIGIICQNLTIGEEEEGGKKRLVDLRRLSLMASPQVKMNTTTMY